MSNAVQHGFAGAKQNQFDKKIKQAKRIQCLSCTVLGIGYCWFYILQVFSANKTCYQFIVYIIAIKFNHILRLDYKYMSSTCLRTKSKNKQNNNNQISNATQLINKFTFIADVYHALFTKMLQQFYDIFILFLFSSLHSLAFHFSSGAIVKNYSTFWADVVAKIPIYQQ